MRVGFGPLLIVAKERLIMAANSKNVAGTVRELILPVAEELGVDNVGAIAEVFGWREDACAKYIAKCKKWKYL